jgi:hypothetical protein
MKLEELTIDRITDLLLHQEFHVKVNFTEKIWSNDELIKLFIKYGYFDFPDPGMNNAERKEYVNNGLKKLNGTKSLKKLIEYIADPRVYISKGISIEDVINYLNKLLIYDGYELQEKDLRHKVVKVKRAQKNKPISKSAKGGRPPDPKIAERNKQLNKDYYNLTEKEGCSRKKALNTLHIEYGLAKTTIEKYIK